MSPYYIYFKEKKKMEKKTFAFLFPYYIIKEEVIKKLNNKEGGAAT